MKFFCTSLLYYFISIFYISIPVSSYGDVTVFNDKIIGKDIDTLLNLTSSVTLSCKQEIHPDRIELYFDNGKYAGAVIYYPYNESNYFIIENALDAIYQGLKNPADGSGSFKVWRVDARKFAVALSEDAPCKDNTQRHILVTYRTYQ